MKSKFVQTGSYCIGPSSSLALEAVLGTCVGVVIYDITNGVGGLHHILLPDPVYLDQNPERYATTGLPLFIHELQEKGADRNKLKAYVAGGALVGKLSRHDFDLDIGGRTTERVMTLLRHTQIPVADSITGGIGGCRMRLELSSMEVNVRAGVWQPSDRSETYRTMDRGQILSTMDRLTPIPQSALRILQNYRNEHYTLKDLTQELKQDQVLSAQTIKLANSALFKRVSQVETIEGAVGMLGRDRVIKWVVANAIDEMFKRSQGGYSLCQGGLYHHARKIAQLCETIACASKTIDPDTAYLAGLLHDIGKVVLDQYIPNAASRLYQQMSAADGDFLKSERMLLGMDHTEAGACLARKWGFPESLIEAIEYHHHPGADELRSSPTAGIVYLADLLLARFEPGATISFPRSDQLIDQLKKANLSQQKLNAVIDAIPKSEFQQAA